MKKTIILLGLFFSVSAYSQLATYDAGANAQLYQQISESMKQTKQLSETYKVMKEAKQKFEQVNGFIQQMGYLQNLINEQKAAVANASKLGEIVSRKKSKTNLAGVTYNLKVISGAIKTVDALLNNGVFNMQDGDRMNAMEREYQKVKSASTNIKVQLIQHSF